MSPLLKQFIANHSKRVNQSLQLFLPSRVPSGERLLEAMSYSLLGAGKRVRPVLVYASAIATGADLSKPLLDACACALECIHAYSLIHDDLPAMDDDDLRRGEPTCHIAFDEATAILAGDALQCLAFEILSSSNGPAPLIVTLIQELSRAAGATGMVVGQMIDLNSVETHPNLEQLQCMHNRKTGALIEAAVVMGAIGGGCREPAKILALRRYAKDIGLSFQVQDDILDVVASTEQLGKRQGADIQRNKPTYVSLLGLEGARNKAEELHVSALSHLAKFGEEADILRLLSAFIIERSA